MKKKILLVDDDLAVRESVARALAYEDFLPIPASDGDEALRVASGTEIDLLLLDLTLPGKSGWDIFERFTGQHPLIPVIIITGRSNQLFPALASGAGALMEKPLDFAKLLQTIRDLLAEPAEARLARLAGKAAEFHYLPGRHEQPPHVITNLSPEETN